MKRDKLSAVAIIMGSAAVLGTLAYLVNQTDRTTETINASTPDQVVETAPKKRSGLEWMIGCWQTEDGGTREVWKEEAYSHLFGHSVTWDTTKKSKEVGFFETMTIIWTGYGYQLSAYPMGKGPSHFPGVDSRDKSITFQNSQHDYPQRIEYTRQGDTLTGTISLADGTKPNAWVYQPCTG